jgi:hypothetical protein
VEVLPGPRNGRVRDCLLVPKMDVSWSQQRFGLYRVFVDIHNFLKNTCFWGIFEDLQADISKSELEECSIGRVRGSIGRVRGKEKWHQAD